MSEKRKPSFTFLLTKTGKTTAGKTNKVEIFPSSLWLGKDKKYGRGDPDLMYRVRVNGAWWPKGERRFFYKTEIMRFISNAISFHPRT